MDTSAQIKIRVSLFILAMMIVANPVEVHAQKPPDAAYVYPPGGKAGTRVQVRLAGYDWTPDQQYFVLADGVQLNVTGTPGDVLNHEPPYWFGFKSFGNDPPLPREVSASLTLPVNLPPGPIMWRVANANGGGTNGIFVVSDGDEVLEDEGRTGPQELAKLPATVSGRLRLIEEVDSYRIKLAADSLVTCELTARRIGSDFRGVIEIRDEHNRLVADTVDTQGVDPVLTFSAKAGMVYTVSLHDLDYRGYRSYVYRLGITPGPRVQAVLPAAIRRGETRSIEFVGLGVESGQARLERTNRVLTAPNDPERSVFAYHLKTPHGTTHEVMILLSDLTETVEPATCPELTAPFALTAVMDQRVGKKSYTLRGKKGETWNLNADAMRLGSPMDLSLTVFGRDGKVFAEADDSPGTTDPALSVTLPDDGLYRIEVRDQSPLSDSLSTITTFRLVGEHPREDFALSVVPAVNVPVGGASPLVVNVVRTGGFKSPISLSVRGLPQGVTVPANLSIGPADALISMNLQAAKNALATASLVRITGTSKIAGRTVTRVAKAPATGNLAPRSPSENLLDRVLVATTLKPPFKVVPLEADGGRRVNRGATYPAELIVERDPGFRGEIELAMAATQSRHRQGIGGPFFTIPPDAKRVAYPVIVPEWLETTRTSRLLLVGMAKVPDGQGKLRYVLSPVAGQITMSIEGALLKVSHGVENLVSRPGLPIDIPVKIARSPVLTGTVRLELIASAKLSGLLRATPLDLPADKDSAGLVIQTSADPRLLGRQILAIRATTYRDALPVVSEAALQIEFR